MKKVYKNILYITFVFYFIFLLKMIVFKYIALEDLLGGNLAKTHVDRVNLNIMKGIFTSSRLRQDFILNIVAFLPLGIYLDLFLKNKAYRFVLRFLAIVFLSFSLSFSFEYSQYYFSIGSFDVNDLLSNTLGGFLGFSFLNIMGIFVKRETLEKLVALGSTLMMLIVVSIYGLIVFTN